RAGDPEFLRYADAPDEPAALNRPAWPGAKRTSPRRAGDPEVARMWIALAENEVASENENKPPRTAPSAIRDLPRFASGDGLDSEAAEIVSELALAELNAPPETQKVQPAVAPEKEETATKEQSEKAKPAVPDPETAELIAKLGGIKPGQPGKTKTKRGAKEAESADPEQRFLELIAQIEKNKKVLAEINKAKAAQAEEAPGTANDEERRRIRDPHSRMVLEALRNNTATATVTGVITDGAARQTTYGRVRLLDATDSAVDAPLPDGFWSRGTFSTTVISGAVKIEAWRGRFAPPYLHGIQARPNTTTHIEIPLSRPASHLFAAKGWYLADLEMGLRVQPGERSVWLSKPPMLDDLLIAAQAEGIQILGVPVPANDPETAKSILEYVPSRPSDVFVLPVFPGPRHLFSGVAMGLGVTSTRELPREITRPEQPLYEAFDEIHALGGLAVYKNLTGTANVDLRRDIFSIFPRLEQSNYFGRNSGPLRIYSAAELPFATVTGPSFDAIAFDGTPAAEQLWFNLLNHNYSLAITGAAGGSLEGGRLPFGQTFIQLSQPLTRESILQAIRQGRTSVSFGPAAFCKIVERDKGPGAVLPADGRPLTLQIQAYSSLAHGMQLHRIDIIRNGEVIHTQEASEGESSVHNLTWPLSETASAWYVVRVTERKNAGGASQPGGSAWTSPIYFRNAAYAEPEPVVTRVRGTLRKGLTPVQGTVTAVVAGQEPRQVLTDASGKFDIRLPSSGSLIFAADGCEPLAYRIFEHPSVQRAIGALGAEARGPLSEHFKNPALFPSWKLLLSELNWEITLLPTVRLLNEPSNADTRKSDSGIQPAAEPAELEK
ncbi:MAG TPA: hypothetical protein VEK08_05895, partial [Planctomycetota bacterium]|nr:hypothetical protein [Planctomycetota bacterium]